MKRSKRIKEKITQVGIFAFMVLIGMFCGFCGVKYIDYLFEAERPLWEGLLFVGWMMLGIYVAQLLQIIIHESGHLIFGLLTGYGFSSFRILSFMWVRQNDRFVFKRMTLAGTAGQCLLTPPEIKDGKYPYVFYNLGGSLMNLIASVVFGLLAWVCRDEGYVFVFSMEMVLIGLAFAITNGLPLCVNGVSNDGYNALSLGKSPEAMRSFWLQLKMNELIAEGIRLKDMPEEWFEVPSDESMKNPMTSVMGVFACNRLMDEQKFEEADALIMRLLSIDSGIIGLYRNMMVNDQIYCELVGRRNPERLDTMQSKQQKKFMKAMKSNPSILRTKYTYALLTGRDEAETRKIRGQFVRAADKYPNAGEVKSERDLIAYAEKIKGFVL